MHYRFQKLALLLSLAIPLLAQAPTPKLMIDARELADYSVIARRIKDFEHLPCKTNATKYNTHAINISDFVGAKVSRIFVLHTAPKEKPFTNAELTALLIKVWQGQFQSASCYIPWAEATYWSVGAAMEFTDSSQAGLLTDGTHVAIQNHSGQTFFLRLLPAAQ
jgi:hypothetical protein